jgi:hypothetical protein
MLALLGAAAAPPSRFIEGRQFVFRLPKPWQREQWGPVPDLPHGVDGDRWPIGGFTMRRKFAALIVLAGLVGASSTAHACGDKFIIVGRCVDYLRTHSAEHPGHVLILWSSNSKAAVAIRDVELQDFLVKAGHRVTVMDESQSTAEAIKSGAYDIVLVDVADADRLRLGLVGTPTRVLPVMYQPTNAEVDQVRQSYHCALNVRHAPIKRTQLLVAVDDAMRRK